MSREPNKTELSALLLLNAERPRQAGAASLSDAQLIALVAGELDAAERDAALAAIATDDDLYHRWQGLMRTAAELAEDPPPATATLTDRVSWLTRLAGWLNPGRLAWIAAPALAAAVIMMVLPVVNTGGDTGALYSRWQGSLQPNVNIPLTGIRGENNVSQPKEIQQQWFEWGVYNGLQKLGDGFAINSLPKYKLQGELPTETIVAGDSLATTGEIAALSWFVCRHRIGPAFIEDVMGVIRPVESVSDEWSLVSPNGSDSREGNIQTGEAYCARTNALIRKLVLLNSN